MENDSMLENNVAGSLPHRSAITDVKKNPDTSTRQLSDPVCSGELDGPLAAAQNLLSHIPEAQNLKSVFSHQLSILLLSMRTLERKIPGSNGSRPC